MLLFAVIFIFVQFLLFYEHKNCPALTPSNLYCLHFQKIHTIRFLGFNCLIVHFFVFSCKNFFGFFLIMRHFLNYGNKFFFTDVDIYQQFQRFFPDSRIAFRCSRKYDGPHSSCSGHGCRNTDIPIPTCRCLPL